MKTGRQPPCFERDIAAKFYFGDVIQREIFSRSPRPLLAITIQRS
jgi:hypothetical protein